MNENKKNLSIMEVNFLYLIIALLLLTVGAQAQSREVYTGLLITEYVIIAIPLLLYLKIQGYSIKETLRLNKISFKQIIYVILIVLFSYPVAVFLNFIGITILSRFGQVMPNPVPIPNTSSEFLLSFLIIAITPGICEEVMFRGVIMNSYRPLGKKKAILYSAILFGIFHFNVQNLLGPIYLGILFGILVFKTNSIFSSIIGHGVNNTIALTIGYFSSEIEQVTTTETVPAHLPTGLLIYTFISLGIMALIFWFIVRKLIKSMPTVKREDIQEPFIEKENIKEKMNTIEMVPIIIVIFIFIIYNYIYFFV